LGRIPEHVVEEVRQRADLVEVVGRQVNLKKSGSRYWGLCPFHTEKTPSFQVHADKQMFHCFGCGVGGDVFAFRMRHDSVEFTDAVRSLAREFGVAIPEAAGSESAKVSPLYEMNERALEYFRQTLRGREGAAARSYLEKRGVPPDLVERFQLGLALPRWDGFLSQIQGKSGAVAIAERAGLLAPRQTGDGHYDRFRGRVVFPIHDPSGRIVGFGGRSLGDDTPKYLNTPETPIFRKGRVFFGLPLALDAIRARARVILVEGYFDVVALKRAGFDECIAPCGTAMTPDHARRLRRYVREVVLLFDGDEAGQQAAQRALPLLSAEGLRVRASFLPAGEDPDTLLASQGEEALRTCVEAAVPLIQHLIEEKLTKPEASAWEAMDAARELAPILAVVTDPIEQATYVREIARRLELPLHSIELALKRGAPRSPQTPPAAAPQLLPAAIVIDPLVRTLLGAVLSQPGLLELVSDFPDEAWPTGPAGALLSTVFATLEEHGDQTVARLLSPVADQLSPELKRSLAEIAAEADPASPSEAERAVRDCVVRLKLRVLDRETRDLTIRLRSCTDSAEQEVLLERKQQILARMTEARSQADHV